MTLPSTETERARRAKLAERNRSHRTDFLYEDAEWMRDAYVTRGLTLREVAAEARCGLRTVARWMKRHGIETRKDWPRASGPASGRWRGATVCPKCGGSKRAGSAACRKCSDSSGTRNSKWRGEAAEYTAIHYRIVAQRGRPSDHQCVRCGARAAEWAYDHADPNEKRNRVGRDDGPYSLDPAHYMPMCVRCHRRLDLGRAAARRKDTA